MQMHSTAASKDFQLLEASKLEFNKKCRRISIKNIPSGVLTQDILELLKPYFYQQIHVDKNSQSCKAVLLDGASAAKCIQELNGKQFRGQYLSVSLASCDFMLCITQLPLSYTYDQFLSLITPFGTPERCFLVQSEITGESKGYGCVEFTSKESSIKAKNQLNGFRIDSNTLQVHWLDAIPSEYSGLSSLCLLVENFPPAFRDTYLLTNLFSSVATPKFSQLANCSSSEFAVVEYSNAIISEKTWKRMNGYRMGNFSLNVSFCVPGPCGIVVLNALKASRDLQRANPSGGLLPTPVHLLDHNNQSYNNGFNLISHKKDMPGSLLPLERTCVAQDVHPPTILSAVTTHLMDSNLHQPIPKPALQSTQPNTSMMWSHGHYSNERSHNIPQVQGQTVWMDAAKHQTMNPFSSHLMLRNRSGSMSSCDSGAKADDDVFEPTRRKSQEDPNQPGFAPALGSHDKVDGLHHYSNTFEMSRSNVMGSCDSHHRLVQTLCNPLTLLREDSQRSESGDSAYSGSQGSNASEQSLPSSQPREQRSSSKVNPHPRYQNGGYHHDGLNTGYPTDMHYRQSSLSANVQRFPLSQIQQNDQTAGEIYQQRASNAYGSFSQSCGNPVTSSGRFSPYRIPSASGKEPSHVGFERSLSLPRDVSSAFSLYSSQQRELDSRIPRPHFNSVGSSVAKANENLRTAPKPWTSRLTPIAAAKQSIGADSPTQLQLLGNNLIEGLLADSPRSASESDSELASSNASMTRRLLYALNLFSPCDHNGDPQTPVPALRRDGGQFLPSPEPSPEAGAYVGQHSQGLGGHYADSPGLGGILSRISTGQQSPFAPALYRRRRSNET
ncbi:unnamed protein product [Clavelina lepadiformis]|uniref:RRM domain-containing protein n=1 Tax=Clavelina lepadiformis TaxID=159417 RepID=A0ABP0GFF2_CLALP